jgi:hypothetical protein
MGTLIACSQEIKAAGFSFTSQGFFPPHFWLTFSSLFLFWGKFCHFFQQKNKMAKNKLKLKFENSRIFSFCWGKFTIF